MKLNRTGSNWTELERNKINENWGIIEKSVVDAEDALINSEEALDKANEAIAKSTSTQTQLDTIVIDGDSSVEAAQARVDEKGGVHSTLKARIDVGFTEVTSQLAQTVEKQSNYMQHFSGDEPYVVEKRGEVHFGGHKHTAFFGGCSFNGKEIYVARNSEEHFTTEARGAIVAYIRNYDGTFTPKVIVPETEVDPRDINISPSRDGRRLFLSAACVINDSSTNAIYETFLWELDENLNVVGNRKKLFDGFGWGNVLTTPNSNLIKIRYRDANGRSGIQLMKSENHLSSSNQSMEPLFTIFPDTDATECTIGYWNNKLVALSRVNGGNMLYRETYNLEGYEGWGDIIELDYVGDAPALMPYNQDKTLLSTISLRTPNESYPRAQAVIATDNGYDWCDPVQLVNFSSSYGTIVPNRYGYGTMFYREFGDGEETEVYHLDFDPNTAIRISNVPNISKMSKTRDGAGNKFIGDCSDFTYFDEANNRETFIYFIPKNDLSIKSLFLFTKNGTTNNNLFAQFQTVQADGSVTTRISVYPEDLPDLNSDPKRVEFPLSNPMLFQKGQLYRIRVLDSFRLGKTSLNNLNRTAINIDLGYIIYQKSSLMYGSNEVFDNSIYPIEFEIE